jgi:DDE superfamily endonuclease
MPAQDTPSPTPLLDALFGLLAAYRGATRQERVFVRLVHLSLGCLLGVGRHTLTQLLVALGIGDADWTAWYRLFNRARIDVAAMQATLLGQALASIPATAPVLAAAVDATQLPRSRKSVPGAGFAVSPRSPKWRRGLHYAQRYVGISLLLPRSASGESRAVPLRWLLLRTAKTTAMGAEPERSEREGALAELAWLRAEADAAGREAQPLLALGDGAYSTAPMLAGLPERTTLLARCAKNRALYALPVKRAGGRGRQPWYGDRGATPQATLHEPGGWATTTLAVRARAVPVVFKITGPWLVKGAPRRPVVLIAVKGIARGTGVTYRQRDPQYFLASLTRIGDRWRLALPVAELLAWAWQRWEVEVMHKELKSGFGAGEQQAHSDLGAATVVPWIVWVYAVAVLAGYRAWGLGQGTVAPLGRWHRPRRWSFARLWQGYREELWQLGEFRPVWARSPDTWAEITHWIAARTNAIRGVRRL